MNKKFFEILVGLILVGLLFLMSFQKLTRSGYLEFSDGAKYAVIARNIVEGNGFRSNFSFFGKNTLLQASKGFFIPKGISPLMPYSIAGSFLVFGINDFAIIATSSFYFLLLILSVFFLGRKLYGNLVGVVSAIVVAGNVNFLDYATSGASEVLFTFLIILAAFLFTFRKRKYDFFAFLTLVGLYYTRPQALVFMAPLVFYWLILNWGVKKGALISIVAAIAAFVVDGLILSPLFPGNSLSTVFSRATQAIFQYRPGEATSNAIRGALQQKLTLAEVFKKVFYNLYNFYKLIPQIMNPYIFALFVISLLKISEDKTADYLKYVSALAFVGLFVGVALTIPFFRYLHPIIPLVCIFASALLVWVVRKIVDDEWRVCKKLLPKFIDKRRFVIFIMTSLATVLFVGQTLGAIFLDSRFSAKTLNKGKPPVYAVLSELLKENTKKSDLIVTNLDTWGSWYGDRTTIWFPVNPTNLKSSVKGSVKPDEIFLTSYLMNDENYYMGKIWRNVLNNPADPSKWDPYIAKNYRLVGVYNISPENNYENISAYAVFLAKK